MKFLISSDYHLNEKNRLDDFVKNLKIIEKESQKNKYDYYIVAGDIFDKKHPTVKELVTFSEHIKNVIAEKIILIRGNHVKISKDFSALDIFNYDKRVIICDEYEIELNKNKKVLITHKSIAEAKVGPKNINLTGIKIDELKKYSFVISGHIHKPQILGEMKNILIPGSIERVNFGERGEDKFYWILDILEAKCTTNLVMQKKLPTRKMLKIVYDLENNLRFINDKEQNPKTTMENVNDAIVQLILRGPKSTVKKVNYDKMMKAFDKVYSLDLKLEYTELPNKVQYSTSCLVMNKENILKQLEVYCKNNNLDKDIFKISEKIINHD